MSSPRRISANKRNAQQSHGPRTSAGKARVSRNALRHGLSVSVRRDPAVSVEVDRLARALVGRDQDGALLGLARIIAEAELDLKRIQITKVSLLNAHLEPISPLAPFPGAELAGFLRPELAGACIQDDSLDDVGVHAHATGRAMIHALPQLVRLHRYERRARSRLRRAMSVFLVHKAVSPAAR
jgi:hypothetical protein